MNRAMSGLFCGIIAGLLGVTAVAAATDTDSSTQKSQALQSPGTPVTGSAFQSLGAAPDMRVPSVELPTSTLSNCIQSTLPTSLATTYNLKALPQDMAARQAIVNNQGKRAGVRALLTPLWSSSTIDSEVQTILDEWDVSGANANLEMFDTSVLDVTSFDSVRVDGDTIEAAFTGDDRTHGLQLGWQTGPQEQWQVMLHDEPLGAICGYKIVSVDIVYESGGQG